MAKQPKAWMFEPAKRAKSAMPGTLKDEVDTKAGELIEKTLKPRHVKPPPEGSQFNYVMQAAGTVTKKLAKWLAEKGYVEDTEDAQERAGEAAKNLPNAQTVLDILNAYCDENAPAKHGGEIEDHFFIDRIEPGKLWLNPLTGSSVIGPIPVPNQVTALCEPGWDIGGVVAKVGKGWHLVEVWNVSP